MPRYKVWGVDSGHDRDSARVFNGFDHEDAAENWRDGMTLIMQTT